MLHLPSADALPDEVARAGSQLLVHDLLEGMPLSTAATPTGYATPMTGLWLDEHEHNFDEGPVDPDEIAIANNLMPIIDEGKLVIHDGLQIVWLVFDDGVQPLIWPLRLHVHSSDCGRA